MGKTVNFLLSDDWLNDQESFGRTVPTYRHPCRKSFSSAIFLFDLHGYAPFITYINKPFGHNIFYQ